MGVALAFRTYDSCCFSDACTLQAITADTVIAYITHDDRPYISSASNRHKATWLFVLCTSGFVDDVMRVTVTSRLLTIDEAKATQVGRVYSE